MVNWEKARVPFLNATYTRFVYYKRRLQINQFYKVMCKLALNEIESVGLRIWFIFIKAQYHSWLHMKLNYVKDYDLIVHF